MAICLYCPSEANSREHPLPAAFGEFENAPLLHGRICRDCNSNRLGILDEQLARCGPEAIMRRYFQVEGRSTHEKVNLHHRGSAGGGRIIAKAYDKTLGQEVELELQGGRQARQLCQIVITEPSGKTHHLPIAPDLRDPKKLRAEFDKLRVVDVASATVQLVCDPEETQWLHPLLKAVWPDVTFGESQLGASNFEQGATFDIRVNLRYFQGIAKIGFHYFLTQFPQFDGSEPCFADVRSFITRQGGPAQLANEFIGERPGPLLGNMKDGARPAGWVAHVLTAEITADACLAHVQFFVSEEYPAPVRSIHLAPKPDNARSRGSGHIYRYFQEGLRGRL